MITIFNEKLPPEWEKLRKQFRQIEKEIEEAMIVDEKTLEKRITI